ncbi:hypothetical protein ASD11_04715 [Aeromicrobium sp. Root495]|uniref:HAD-IIA family hydrolase n=1 Tax=Aeromicrobium sp. Root495 TaxID=1736550 RepID=UPI0007001979|nr:HAD-IIA family hydrolase [Aeromicrobium sp. Root495]KQY58928.1 hypothetical protein ASD11_04715 [Aeromicrobium sp. Root495]
MVLASSDVPLHSRHDLVMLDLDGVVYVGPDAVPGAAEALESVRSAGTAVAYLTNNAARPAAVVAEHLQSLGMPLREVGEVITSAQAVARLMAHDLPSDSEVLLVGGEGLRLPLEDLGLRCVTALGDDTAAVVQGFNPDLGWKDLAEATYAVARGLPWYASNTDLTVPTPRGIAPGNGSLVALVRGVTGRDPVVAGKPEKPLFEETLTRTGAERPLMVGDRLDTDIEGANRIGIPSLAVLTGVDSLATWVQAAEHLRPAFVSTDLSGLLEEHHPVEVAQTSATCGDAGARLQDGTITLTSGEPGTTSALRAVLALAWHVVDGGAEAPALDERMTS